MPGMERVTEVVFRQRKFMATNAHARRLARRATVRKAAAGELGEAETKEVQAAETARKAAIKPPAVLNRKQRKSQKVARRKAKK